MKKWMIVTVSIVVLSVLGIFAWVGVGTVFAQTPTPQSPNQPFGMMGGWGGRSGAYGMMGGGYGMMGVGNDGAMHTYMVSALADALNLTTDEIQSRIDNGETPWEIAQAEGLTDEQVQQVILEAHDQALDQAVEAGALTQEQADWMDQHMEAMWSGNTSGFGNCPGMGGYNGSQSGAGFGGRMMRWFDTSTN